MFHVYILYSYSLKKYYVSSSQHHFVRIEEHNRGKTTFTRTGIPWSLMYAITCEDVSCARELEFKIKKRGCDRFLESLKSNLSSAD